MDSEKGNDVTFRGTAKDLKSALAAAEKKIAELIEERREKTAESRVA